MHHPFKLIGVTSVKALGASVIFTMLAFSPALADPIGTPNGGVGNGNGNGNEIHAAPGPLLGAGIPGLAIGIGYGVYWLARRRQNRS
jgi:hypothetical protein